MIGRRKANRVTASSPSKRRAEQKPRKRAEEELRPRWDGRRLWWDDRIAKAFGREAPSQMPILAEFERLRWPRQIDASGLWGNGRGSANWLHDVVQNLNRFLKWLRFRVDSKAKTIRWEKEQ